MKRVIIICEGPTEQEFCTEILGLELAKHHVYVEAPLIKHSHGGIVPWSTFKRQIVKHLQEGEVYVSMLVDYYGIREQFCFPGWEKSMGMVDKSDRLHFLFEQMSADIPEEYRHRFIPYIQLHEFEGLLFSDIHAFLKSFPKDEIRFDDLQVAVDSFENPELINNSPQTAPSKRLINAIPDYDKIVYGNCVAIDIGLKKIREKCPLFNEWVEKLLDN